MLYYDYQCKQISALSIQEIFVHNQLRSIKLAFTTGISDEVFLLLPPLSVHPDKLSTVCTSVGISSMCSPSILCYPAGTSFTNDMDPFQSQYSLEQLELGRSSITDESLFRLARCGTSLREISLQWCDFITDNGVRVLVRHCLSLQDVNLRSCSGITDDSLEAIGQECTVLKRLNISWCQDISDHGVKLLTPSYSGTCTALESICVVWCSKVSDVSLRALATLPLLTTVEATGCDGISEACVSQLDTVGIKVIM